MLWRVVFQHTPADPVMVWQVDYDNRAEANAEAAWLEAKGFWEDPVTRQQRSDFNLITTERY